MGDGTAVRSELSLNRLFFPPTLDSLGTASSALLIKSESYTRGAEGDCLNFVLREFRHA